MEMADRDTAELARQQRVSGARQRHAIDQRSAERKFSEVNLAVDRMVAEVGSGERRATTEYFCRVIEGIVDPPGFPTARRVAYVPESTLAVLEWDVPKVSIVPEYSSFKYIKTRDEIDAKDVPIAHRRSTYQRLIVQIALRSLRLIFGSDPHDLVDTVVFNGMIDDVDRSTGQDVRRCLITMRATRDHFSVVNLERVGPVDCVRKHFAADISEHPEELKAVPPVIEFSMADPRVVDPIDILSEIDRRPNLLDLTPVEF
jgi:restriction system protein